MAVGLEGEREREGDGGRRTRAGGMEERGMARVARREVEGCMAARGRREESSGGSAVLLGVVVLSEVVEGSQAAKRRRARDQRLRVELNSPFDLRPVPHLLVLLKCGPQVHHVSTQNSPLRMCPRRTYRLSPRHSFTRRVARPRTCHSCTPSAFPSSVQRFRSPW